jgi:TolB protein
MDPHGRNQYALTHSPALDRVPRFNDVGTQIIFRSERNGDSEIFAMNLDGTDMYQITDNGMRDMHPDW